MLHAGTCLLASLVTVPAAATISGVLSVKLHDIRLSLWIGFAMCAAGMGAFASFTSETTAASTEGIQVLFGFGLGLIYPSVTILSQVGQPDELHTIAMNLVYFFRTLGATLGVSISGTILQNRWNTLVDRQAVIGDIDMARLIRGQDALTAFDSIAMLPQGLVSMYRQVYGESLQAVWYTCMSLLLVCWLASLTLKPTNLDRGHTSSQRFQERREKPISNSPVSSDSV